MAKIAVSKVDNGYPGLNRTPVYCTLDEVPQARLTHFEDRYPVSSATRTAK